MFEISSADHKLIVSLCIFQGEGKKALYHYKAALKLDPSNSIVNENLRKLQKLRH